MRLRSFKIITFGCRLNQAESREIGEKLAKILRNLDIRELRAKEKADVVVINTCCVTQKAEREVRKEIRRVKKENPDCFLVVTGCWINKLKTPTFASGRSTLPIRPCSLPRRQAGARDASSYALQSRASKDKSVGRQSLKLKARAQSEKLIKLIDLKIANEEKEKIGEILRKKFSHLTIKQLNNGAIYQDKYAKSKKALIKIQDGCNNFCSYCIVPYVRGRSRSRPAERILEEIRQKIKEGIEEVILTGVNIGDYELKVIVRNLKLEKLKNDLVKLIKLILQETEIKKISFGSINIKIFDKEFIYLYQNPDTRYRLSSHFHIPLQSGCDQTLRRMARKYTVKEFISVIKKLKAEVPGFTQHHGVGVGFTFSTDFIVGFPGETQLEFKETLKNLKELKSILGEGFTSIHVFRYSRREPVLAEKQGQRWGWVSEKEKKKRAGIVRKLFS